MISALSKESWDAKNIELGGSILQSWAWGEFQQSLGHKIHRFSGDNFICFGAEIPLTMNKKYLYCPRGPVGQTDLALADLKKLENNRDLVFSRLEPFQAVNLPHAAKDIQPAHNWMLSLDKSEEELLIGMKPKTRYNINLAQRKGVVVRESSLEDLLIFFELMMETASRNEFRLHPQNYYFQMWDHLAPQKLKLLLAFYQNVPVAGLLMSIYGSTATYLHGGSSQRFKDAMAPYVLHWEGIRLAKNLECTTYDFGGVAPVAHTEKHEWAGITRFKKSFGGFEVNYPGAYDLIYSPIWYNVYKNARKLKGVLRLGYRG